MPILGLSVGGVDPNCTAVGYIAFVRAGKDAEKENFKHYQEHIFRPYVSRKRNLCDGIAPTEVDRAVSCSDGGGAQLGALLEEESIEAANNLLLTLVKHSTSRTAAEQYADLARVFKLMKSVSKTITAKNQPLVGFKKKVYNQLMELDRTDRIYLKEKILLFCLIVDCFVLHDESSGTLRIVRTI